MSLTKLFRRRRPALRPGPARVRPRVEALESRDLLSNFTLGDLTQVSGPSPFAGCGSDLLRNDETEPWVAVNPTNPNHLVAAWIQDLAVGIVAGVSFNAGQSWQSVVIPGLTLCSGGTFRNAADPWVSFAPNGDVYVASLALDLGGSPVRGIMVNKSTDGGLSWNPPVNLAQTLSTAIFADKESITTDPTDPNLVYAVWTRDSTLQTMFTRTTDGGQTWETPRAISLVDQLSIGDQILVLPDGGLVDLVGENVGKASDDFRLSVLRSSDKGVTWSGPIQGPQILPIAVTDPETGQLVVTSADPNEGTIVEVAVDRNTGHLYAVWEDARFSGGQHNSIAFTMSTDGGLTWSAPVKINKTPTGIAPGNQQAFLPSIAVAANGAVAVTYYDFRNNTPATGLPTDYWVIHAHPDTDLTNPANWRNELRLTTTSFDMEKAPFVDAFRAFFVGDYVGLAAAGNDFVPIWSMPHGTDQASTFFRRIRQSGHSSLLATSIGSGAEVETLTLSQVPPLLTEAFARWQETGVKVSSFAAIDIQIADLDGATLGMASGHTIWLDDNAAGWGWFVDRTPGDDSEFTTPGNQGEQNRMDLFTVLEHELGHLLCYEHEATGVMQDTLSAGVRELPDGIQPSLMGREATELIFALLSLEQKSKDSTI